ncbi:MAG: hypothetical protein Q7U76_04500 [Nitrospirota bacterium]|nr:hypothetical protein [Nitrospirota bacterium]
MSPLFPESPLQCLADDVLTANEAVLQGTDTTPQSLLSSPDSGMIVFSSSARILHMNGPARALMALFGDSHELWPQMAPESMPSFLTEFCRDVLAQLHRRVETEDWAQFEMRRICHMVTPSLLLRGFGVPHSAGHELRIILTLDPLLSPPHPGNSPVHLQPLAPMPADLARTQA